MSQLNLDFKDIFGFALWMQVLNLFSPEISMLSFYY